MHVATVLTVYGIETQFLKHFMFKFCCVATVLTVYGIETQFLKHFMFKFCCVATVLTVYGIETELMTVNAIIAALVGLQQCLPFTVLKRENRTIPCYCTSVATVLTVYGIETRYIGVTKYKTVCCNSAYRLRY